METYLMTASEDSILGVLLLLTLDEHAMDCFHRSLY